MILKLLVEVSSFVGLIGFSPTHENRILTVSYHHPYSNRKLEVFDLNIKSCAKRSTLD